MCLHYDTEFGFAARYVLRGRFRLEFFDMPDFDFLVLFLQLVRFADGKYPWSIKF